jgi:hypothetical protein
MTLDERELRAVFAPARTLEPTDAEVARVLARRPPRGRRRRARVALAATLAVLGASYVAVPPLRAAVDDVAATFSGWLGTPGGNVPGRPLGAHEQAPDYFRDPTLTADPRVIAEAGGYKLYAARDAYRGGVEFDLGDTGVGLGYTPADVRGHALLVLGPGAMQHADAHGHVPLFGVTARSIRTVELTYRTGPPLKLDGVAGGFVLLAEPARGPVEVIGYDAAGQVVERAKVDDSDHWGPRIDWRRYG